MPSGIQAPSTFQVKSHTCNYIRHGASFLTGVPASKDKGFLPGTVVVLWYLSYLWCIRKGVSPSPRSLIEHLTYILLHCENEDENFHPDQRQFVSSIRRWQLTTRCTLISTPPLTFRRHSVVVHAPLPVPYRPPPQYRTPAPKQNKTKQQRPCRDTQTRHFSLLSKAKPTHPGPELQYSTE